MKRKEREGEVDDTTSNIKSYSCILGDKRARMENDASLRTRDYFWRHLFAVQKVKLCSNPFSSRPQPSLGCEKLTPHFQMPYMRVLRYGIKGCECGHWEMCLTPQAKERLALWEAKCKEKSKSKVSDEDDDDDEDYDDDDEDVIGNEREKQQQEQKETKILPSLREISSRAILSIIDKQFEVAFREAMMAEERNEEKKTKAKAKTKTKSLHLLTKKRLKRSITRYLEQRELWELQCIRFVDLVTSVIPWDKLPEDLIEYIFSVALTPTNHHPYTPNKVSTRNEDRMPSSWETVFGEWRQGILLEELIYPIQFHSYGDSSYTLFYVSDPPSDFLSGEGLTEDNDSGTKKESENEMEEEGTRKEREAKYLISDKAFLEATRLIEHSQIVEKLKVEDRTEQGIFMDDAKETLSTIYETKEEELKALKLLLKPMQQPPFNLKHLTFVNLGLASRWDLFLIGVTPAGNILGFSTHAES